LYRPPSAPSSSITDLCSILESMLLSHKHVVACGDLNIDTSDTTHPHSRSFQNFILSHHVLCPIVHPTRISLTRSSVFDHFVASSEVPISHFSIMNWSISDHLPISLIIDWSIPDPPFKVITRHSSRSSTQMHSMKTLQWHHGL
jgi:endonuclease/exonuclease/phosphatase family metal-dependent hydrolase